MEMNRWIPIGAVAVMAALVHGCGGGEGTLSSAPSGVTMVARGGFTHPLDAVSTPDGRTFYFTAFGEGEEAGPGIFRVAAGGGAAESVYSGAPLAFPTGLVMSCDGSTVYVADMRSDPGDEPADSGDVSRPDRGALYALATAGGSLAPLPAEGIAVPTGLALSVDCSTLYVTGWTAEGVPALFTLPVGGGMATVVHEGAPFVSVTGVHVDAESTAWVMDHRAGGGDAAGVLFAVRPDGTTTQVIDGLRLGAPGGVSLTSEGGTAVIPTVNEDGGAELLAVEIASGRMAHIETPMIQDPAGLRTAREAPVLAVVDSEGGAILRAE